MYELSKFFAYSLVWIAIIALAATNFFMTHDYGEVLEKNHLISIKISEPCVTSKELYTKCENDTRKFSKQEDQEALLRKIDSICGSHKKTLDECTVDFGVYKEKCQTRITDLAECEYRNRSSKHKSTDPSKKSQLYHDVCISQYQFLTLCSKEVAPSRGFGELPISVS